MEESNIKNKELSDQVVILMDLVCHFCYEKAYEAIDSTNKILRGIPLEEYQDSKQNCFVSKPLFNAIDVAENVAQKIENKNIIILNENDSQYFIESRYQ